LRAPLRSSLAERLSGISLSINSFVRNFARSLLVWYLFSKITVCYQYIKLKGKMASGLRYGGKLRGVRKTRLSKIATKKTVALMRQRNGGSHAICASCPIQSIRPP
jgi:hypothetical protein